MPSTRPPGAAAEADAAAVTGGPAEPPVAEADPRARRADRVTSLIEVVFCSGVPSQLLLAVTLQAAGWRPFSADGQLSLGYITALSLADTLIIVSLAVVFLASRGETPRVVLLGTRPMGREALVGLALLPPIVVGVGALGLALRTIAPWLHNVPDNPLAALMRDPVSLAVFAVVVVLAGGLREEAQRAFILHRFRQHLGGPRVGLWVTSVAFGLGHLLQGYDAAILTAVLGFIWGAVFLRRGSLLAPVVSHAAFNLVEVARQAMAP
jgi:membrane protease YdiL (CAAX protease family)